MHQGTSRAGNTKITTIRLPPGLHATSMELAQTEGISWNDYVVRALQAAVRADTAAGVLDGDEVAQYEATLGFELLGTTTDERARQFCGRAKEVLELYGAQHVSARVVRFASMQVA